MVINNVCDLKLVARSATNRIVFYDSNDRPVVGIKVTDQVQVSYTEGHLVIINNESQVYRFTVYALYDIDGKGFTVIDNNTYTIEDYQQKIQEAFEWLQTVVLVSCCDGGDNPLELRFYPNLASFPSPGTLGLLYIDESANTIYRWDGSNYVELGGGGGLQQATASGTDTYSATISGVAAYNDGDAYLIRFTNGNTTGCTLNINGLGARVLYRNNDGPLIGGDILDGAEMLCVYNSILNGFQVIGTAPNTLLAYVTNDDSVTLTKGTVVYAFSGTGDRMTVKRAANTSDATSAQTVGLVLSSSIAVNQKGFIMMQGLLDGLSILPTSTYSDGDAIYLGATPGSITNVKPYAPNHLVYLGVVTTANNGSAGRMYVKVQNGYELDELHNVQAQSPSLKDTLWYDSTVSPPQWKTASLSTILGYTPVPDTRNITINGVTQNLSADRTWTVSATPGAYTATLSVDTNDLNASIAGDGILTLTPTTNVKLTGMQGGANGRTITVFNGSSNYFVFLECNTTSSSAGNRFFNPAGSYIILAPLEMQKFTYNSVTNQWVSDSLHLSKQFDHFDDFIGPFTTAALTAWTFSLGPWSIRGSGVTGASASSYLGTVDRYTRRGTYLLRVGQTATNLMGFASHNVSASGGNIRLTGAPAGSYRLISGSITSLVDMDSVLCSMAVGFSSSFTPAPATDGIFWRYSNTDSIGGGGTGTWKCHIAGSITVDSGITYTPGMLYQLGVIDFLGGGGLNTYSCFYAVQNGVISFGVRENATSVTDHSSWVGVNRVSNSATNSEVLVDYKGFKSNLANPT